MVYDALEMTYRTLKLRKDPTGAPVTELIDYEAFCGTISEEAAEAAKDSTISVRQLEALLEARDKGETDFLLVDVREPNEYEIVSIPGAVLIPKNEFLIGDALAQLPQDKPVILLQGRQPLGRGARGRSRPPGSPTPSTSAAACSPGSTRSSRASPSTDPAPSDRRGAVLDGVAALQELEGDPARRHRQPVGDHPEEQHRRHRGRRRRARPP